jgi:hypothetical protein
MAFSLLDCKKVEFALVFWDSPPLLANFHKLLGPHGYHLYITYWVIENSL